MPKILQPGLLVYDEEGTDVRGYSMAKNPQRPFESCGKHATVLEAESVLQRQEI